MLSFEFGWLTINITYTRSSSTFSVTLDKSFSRMSRVVKSVRSGSILFLVFLSPFVYSQTFEKSSSIFTPVWISASAFADLDNDSDLDLLISGSEAGANFSTRIYVNNGAGVYSSTASILPGINEGNIDLADVNKDGRVDILLVASVSLNEEKRIHIYLNKGNFIFEELSHNLPALIRGVGKFGDFDNDGDPDLLLAGSDISNQYHDIYRNDNGMFTPLEKQFPLYHEPSVSCSDYDVDGDLDYVYSGNGTVPVTLFRNDGNENFTQIAIDQVTVFESNSTWGDYNSDGLPDLIIVGWESQSLKNVFTLFINKGNDIFEKHPFAFTPIHGGNATFGDLDNDGDLDILATGNRTEAPDDFTSAYINTNTTFTQQDFNLPQLSYSHVALGDVDNDHDLDIVLTGNTGSQSVQPVASLYLNGNTSPNVVPERPSGLNAVIDGQRAIFSWSASTDSKTPTAALTYNAFVGTVDDPQSILESESNIATGYRRVVNIGNLGHATTMTIDNLAPGTYSCAVQSIDNNFSGSTFSDPVQFTVAAMPPVITDFQPSSSIIGSEILILGKNFMTVTEVTINGIAATFRIVNSTAIMATIPVADNTGKISVKNNMGKTVSANTFCIKPSVTSITGSTYACPGAYKYAVDSSRPGVTYEWIVSEHGDMLENNNDNVTVSWNAGGDYTLKVIPSSCVTGEQFEIAVKTYGPKYTEIAGPTTALTENLAVYSVPEDSYTQYRWTLSSGGKVSDVVNHALGVTWTTPGTHTLTVYRTDDQCPTGGSISTLSITVALNDFSFYDTATIEFSNSVRPLIADFDNNGYQDILTTSGRFQLNAQGRFLGESAEIFPIHLSHAIIDFDHDNDPDVLFIYSNEIFLYENKGNQNFLSKWRSGVIPDANIGNVRCLDYDNDGDPDILYFGSNMLEVFENNGSGIFVKGLHSALFIEELYSGTPEVRDVNNDGFSDVLTSRGVAFINNQKKDFVPELNLLKSVLGSSAPYHSSINILWADLDNSGSVDFAEVKDGSLKVYKNTGSGFSNIFSEVKHGQNFIASFADVNNDGFNDIIINRLFYEIAIAYYDGSTQTVGRQTTLLAPSARSCEVMDVDKDGSPDIILSSSTSQVADVYRNNTPAAPVPPVPVQLSATVDRNEVTLSWIGNSNLKSNIVVGRTPNGLDVMSPLANLQTGASVTLDESHIFNANDRRLKLTPGTYYWAVQHIAANKNASVFSEWKSFVIGESTLPPPTIANLEQRADGVLIHLTDNSSNESGFVFQRSTGDLEVFTTIGEVGANTADFIDHDFVPGNIYYYRAYAFNNNGNSYYSDVVSSSSSVISTFTFKESFEDDSPTWTQVPWEKMDPYKHYTHNYPNSFQKVAIFPRNGEHMIRMDALNYGSSAAGLMSPPIKITGMTNPGIHMDYEFRGDVGQEDGVRLYITDDNGVTWKRQTIWTHYNNDSRFDFDLSPFRDKTIRMVVSASMGDRPWTYLNIDNVKVLDYPSSPWNVHSQDLTATYAKIVWDHDGTGSHYVIQRIDASGRFETMDTIPNSRQYYIDTKVIEGGKYDYRILGYNVEEDVTSMSFKNSIITIPPADPSFKLIVEDQSMQLDENSIAHVQLVTSDPAPSVTYSVYSENPEVIAGSALSVQKTPTGCDILIAGAMMKGKALIGIRAQNGARTTTEYFLVLVNTVLQIQTITFEELLDMREGSADFILQAFSSSGLPVSFSSSNQQVISIAGEVASVVGAGTATITAHQQGNSYYAAAADVLQEITVTSKLEQHFVSYAANIIKTIGDAPFAISAQVSSGLTVVHTSDNPSVATVEGNIVTIHSAGIAVITASQPGNDDYTPAQSVTQTLTVKKKSQTITFNTLKSLHVGETITLNPTSDAGLPITYTSSNPSVVLIENNKLRGISIGTAVVTASQDGNEVYDPAVSVMKNAVVDNLSDQVITFNTFGEKVYGDPSFTLTAVSSSGLPVSYSSGNVSVASLDGNKITINGAGTTVITATQNGNSSYKAAVPVEQTLIVKKAVSVITFEDLPVKKFGDADFVLSATSNSGLPIVYTADNLFVVSLTGSLVSILHSGVSAITASQNESANYLAATPVQQMLYIQRGSQTIDFPALDPQEVNVGAVLLKATSTSGLPVHYTSNDQSIAIVSGEQLQIVGLGNVIITAHQDGDNDYFAAEPVMQLLKVNTVLGVEHDLAMPALYPNPTTSSVTIKLPVAPSEAVVISIFDTHGLLVKYYHLEQSDSISLDLGSLKPGLYVVRILLNGKVYWERVVKG